MKNLPRRFIIGIIFIFLLVIAVVYFLTQFNKDTGSPAGQLINFELPRVVSFEIGKGPLDGPHEVTIDLTSLDQAPHTFQLVKGFYTLRFKATDNPREAVWEIIDYQVFGESVSVMERAFGETGFFLDPNKESGGTLNMTTGELTGVQHLLIHNDYLAAQNLAIVPVSITTHGTLVPMSKEGGVCMTNTQCSAEVPGVIPLLGGLPVTASCSGCDGPKTPAAPTQTYWKVPVVINIMNNAGITEAEARAAVEEAGKVLDNANANLNVKLNVVAVNNNNATANAGDDGSGGGTAGDGSLTVDEGDKTLTKGGKEIDKLADKKGIKINFANVPEEGQAGPGFSVHRNPTIVVKARPADNATQRGIIIAHELAHVLTVPEHSADPTNLMNPKEPPGGNTGLTDPQAKEINKGLPGHGKQMTKKSPGRNAMQQYGGRTDDSGDSTPGTAKFFDLGWMRMSSLVGVDEIDTVLALNGPFPDVGKVNATYRLLLDTDASAKTGTSIAGYAGIHREVRIEIKGNASTASLKAAGMVIDRRSDGDIVPLPIAPQLFMESRLDSIPLRLAESQIVFAIPKSLLGNFGTLDVPIGVVDEDETGSMYDKLSLTLNLDQFADEPSMTIFKGEAKPGDHVYFTVRGLTPKSPFKMFVGDAAVLAETLSADGTFIGTFKMPNLARGTYFVDLQDQTGSFAFGVITLK